MAIGPGSARRETRLTLGAARLAARPTLIVWGESSVGYDLYTDHAVLHGLSETVGHGRNAVAGQPGRSKSFGAKSKVAVLVGPGGIEGAYVKTRLVPFGEYIPFRSLLGWLYADQPGGAAEHDFRQWRARAAGRPYGRAAADFGVLICFESSFPDMSAIDTSHGAQVLMYQTSDATFQDSWALRSTRRWRPFARRKPAGWPFRPH